MGAFGPFLGWGVGVVDCGWRLWPLLGVFLFRGGGFVGCVQNREPGASKPHLPGFILLVSLSDTLLVVSILVYGCRLWPLLQS